MAAVVFWASAFLLLHTYFLYPLSLVLLEALRQLRVHLSSRRHRPADVRPLERRAPLGVSVVVAAYDEATCIREKIENTLALDYPYDRLDMVIGSDGSTDGTDEIVRQFSSDRVRLSSAPRAGKTSVLNRCIPDVAGEIVILTDANTRVDADAVQKLVRHFDDPEVGAVCGRLELFNPSKGDYEESAYWTYESLLKLYEGRQGAVVGANGGLYAIRRGLFTALPPSTIVDDFVIPLRILDHGYRVVYEPEAVAHEETTEDYTLEFKRRARIAAGNFQSLSLLRGLLSPTRGFPAFAFWSHKVLRWCAPALMALALLSNLFLVTRPLFQATLLAQVGFYALAAAGKSGVLQPWALLRRAASVAHYFVTMNLAIAVGFWRFVRHAQAPAWERTARA